MGTEILTQDQIAFLDSMSRTPAVSKHFYLTGGTPLAAFYLHHRYSEDLDFFSETEIDLTSLNAFFKQKKNELGITKIDFQQSFNRNLFFLTYKNITIKTEFTYFPFPRIQLGESRFGLQVDSLLDIAVNKLFTIYQRTKARDYIDLFMICKTKGYSISSLIKQARAKFDWHIDPLQLGTQFMKASVAEDQPRMLIKLAHEEWRAFFLQEAKRLKNQVVE